MNTEIKIGRFTVDNTSPVFIIAEAGVNHNGDIALAKKLVAAAKNAGANAVKFQTFDPESLVTANAPKAEYQKEKTGHDGSQQSMLSQLALSHNDFRSLATYASEQNILFLSTPFSTTDADFLDAIGVPAFKIGSGDLTNIPLLEDIARKTKPIILSTGMATLDEIHEAVDTITREGNTDLILLHCVSLYPTPLPQANVRSMQTLAASCKCLAGYSDHTISDEAALAATALGARVIEKHITLDKTLPGPDHAASLEPDAFAEFVTKIRNTEAVLGSAQKIISPEEKAVAAVARKSIVTNVPLKKNAVITRDHLTIKRPGTGIPPKFIKEVIGKKLIADVPADMPLQWDMFQS